MYVCIDLYGPLNRLSIRDSSDLFVNQTQSEKWIFKSGIILHTNKNTFQDVTLVFVAHILPLG